MEKQVLQVKNSFELLVNVVEELGRCKIFMSGHGNPTLWYQIDKNGGVYGTKLISKRLPSNQKEELCYALSLIKKHYNEENREQAIEDFYPRIKSITNRLYKGDFVLFSWLKNQDESHLVTTHADLFRRAAAEMKKKRKNHQER